MRTRLLTTLLVSGLALTACGGDDDGGGSAQDRVADMLIDSINESLEGGDLEGVTIDEECIRDAAGDLSDDDAQEILDAGPEGDAEVSPEGELAGEAMVDCIEIDFVDLDGDVDG